MRKMIAVLVVSTLASCGTASASSCITASSGARYCGASAKSYCKATRASRRERLRLDKALGEREPKVLRNERTCNRLIGR